MPVESRVLTPEPVATLGDYLRQGGGRGLDAARRLGPTGVIEDLEAAGLRGRGGAGFPTGRKWRTVAENLSPAMPATIVVNAAEGEPGTFKDRAIVRANPYQVLEGALAAAVTLGSDGVILALKATFHREIALVRAAMDEVRAAGWAEGVDLFVVEGPSEYLFGEETAMLEVIAGRPPFPRVAPLPPRRRRDGHGGRLGGVQRRDGRPRSPAHAAGAGEQRRDLRQRGRHPRRGGRLVPRRGHRSVDGHHRLHRHRPHPTPRRGRVPNGDTPRGGDRHHRGRDGARARADGRDVWGGHPLLPASALDTPVSYEGMEAAGSGLGTGGFIVFDDTTDPAAVAQGVSHFLAVESCGQCTPCKQDGLALSQLLDGLRRSESDREALAAIEDRVSTVSERARCYLAHQHQRVVESILRLFPDELAAHVDGRRGAGRRELIVPILDLADGHAVLDEHYARKQPDWTFDDTYSGQSPADRTESSQPE